MIWKLGIHSNFSKHYVESVPFEKKKGKVSLQLCHKGDTKTHLRGIKAYQ
jgi:hypothetical protein